MESIAAIFAETILHESVWIIQFFSTLTRGVTFNGVQCISKIVATRCDDTLQKFRGKQEAEQVRLPAQFEEASKHCDDLQLTGIAFL